MSVPVFLSYAPENSAELALVVRHLTPLVSKGVIRLLDSLDPGAIAAEEIDVRLAEAKIVLLLITSEYFASASFNRDWKPVVERIGAGAVKVRPVLLKPALWQGQKIGNTDLEQLKPLPDRERFVFDDGQADSRMVEVARAIQAQAMALSGLQPASESPVRVDPVSQATDAVARSLTRSNVVFFLSSGGTPDDAEGPPQPFEVAQELLTRLKLIGKDYDELLPPSDVAAALFAASRSPRGLVDTIDDIYRQRAEVPTLHGKLASLLKGLSESRSERRGLIDEPQLIITTAVDLSMEMALLGQGLSFSRVVQHWSADKLTVNQYLDVSLSPSSANPQRCAAQGGPPGDHDGFEAVTSDMKDMARLVTRCGRFDVEHDTPTPHIGEAPWSGGPSRGAFAKVPRHTSSNAMAELSIRDLQQPVLYKIRGSLDLPSSMALSTDQYIELVLKSIVGQRVPKEIAQQVANNIGLFLGFSVLDSEFRLTYGLFREQIVKGHDDSYERYLVQQPPAGNHRDKFRKAEHVYWQDVVDFARVYRKVRTLEVSPVDFIDGIAGGLAAG